MKAIELNTVALLDTLEFHKEIKSQLLSLIAETKSHTEFNRNKKFDDSISKLDWNSKSDLNREWVKLIKPHLQNKFDYFAKNLNYESTLINHIWFQQYKINDSHGWHLHGENYTGVYYLEHPKGSPGTELIDQTDINKRIIVDANEGDVVIFPSFIIHRAPRVNTNIRKTIISFNIEFNSINHDIFKNTN